MHVETTVERASGFFYLRWTFVTTDDEKQRIAEQGLGSQVVASGRCSGETLSLTLDTLLFRSGSAPGLCFTQRSEADSYSALLRDAGPRIRALIKPRSAAEEAAVLAKEAAKPFPSRADCRDGRRLKALAVAGLNLDAVNDRGLTALVLYASDGDATAVKNLLEAGADPSIVCHEQTALQVAQLKKRSGGLERVQVIALLATRAHASTERRPCARCGVLILSSIAVRNGGLCLTCKPRDRI